MKTDQQHLGEKTQGLQGFDKTTAIIAEYKKHFKLNILKKFLNAEAENGTVLGSQNKGAVSKKVDEKTVAQSETQTVTKERISENFKLFQKEIVD